MNFKLKFLSWAALAAVLFVGCSKEELLPTTSTLEQTPTESVLFSFKRDFGEMPKKGYHADYSTFSSRLITVDVATDTDNNQYKTLKIPRDNGEYFYIMIENLRYNGGNGSYIYNDDNNNISKYGRLYNWQRATELGARVSMKFPSEVEGWGDRYVYGKLPNLDHIKALLVKHERDNRDIKYYGELLDNLDIRGAYFDIFTFGIEKANIDEANHTLAGWMENPNIPQFNPPFRDINAQGNFWTRQNEGNESAPLIITYKNDFGVLYNYTANMYTGYSKDFGFSVRYVFDPFE